MEVVTLILRDACKFCLSMLLTALEPLFLETYADNSQSYYLMAAFDKEVRGSMTGLIFKTMLLLLSVSPCSRRDTGIGG
jgi:hypothetical protein